MTAKRQSPALPWRLLAQGPGKRRVSVTSDAAMTCDGSSGPVEFDELVIARWLHLERLDVRTWWMGVEVGGGRRVMLHFTIRRDGTARVWLTEGKARGGDGDDAHEIVAEALK